jgi:hypothetical protein
MLTPGPGNAWAPVGMATGFHDARAVTHVTGLQKRCSASAIAGCFVNRMDSHWLHIPNGARVQQDDFAVSPDAALSGGRDSA